MKVRLSRTDNTDMCRRAFARHRTGAALLLGLSLRAPSASAERAEPDESRVGTVEGKAAEELPFEPALRAGVAVLARIRYRYILYVRGAPPGNADDFLDRVRVPHLYPIGIDPSVIHQGLIDRVDLDLGGYPARFGRFADGDVSAQTRGLARAPSGEANVRAFDLGDLFEPTFARGRGSLFPALLSLLIPELQLDNRDYQARPTHEPSARDRFSVFGFGSYGLLGEKRHGILTRFGDAFRPKITFTW